MIALVLVGVLTFGAIGILSAFGPELRSGDDGGGHALSNGSTGFGAMPRLLRDVGVQTSMHRGGGVNPDALLIVTPSPTSDREQVDAIESLGPILIVLPKWRTTPDLRRPGWVRTVGALDVRDSLAVLPARFADQTTITQASNGVRSLVRPDGEFIGRTAPVTAPRRISGPDWIPVVVDQDGEAVLVMHREGNVYVLADADLISTHGLRTLEGAQTAVSMVEVIRPDASPVIFDLTLHGFELGLNLPRLLLKPPLVGVTIVLVATLLAAGLQAAVRFGPHRQGERKVPLGKHALADSTAGLVRMAGREPQMAEPYAQLTRMLARKAVSVPRGTDEREIEAVLDRLARAAGSQDGYADLVAEAKSVRTPGALVQIAQRLYRWKEELTVGRR